VKIAKGFSFRWTISKERLRENTPDETSLSSGSCGVIDRFGCHGLRRRTAERQRILHDDPGVADRR
jgi:hypothetical protein